MERRLVHAAAAAGRHRRDVHSHANIRHMLACGGAPWLRRERARRRPQTAARQAGACACGAVRVNIARAIHRTLRLTTSACSPPPQRPPEQDEQASASAPSTDRETAAAADAGGWEFERVVNVANGISLARGLSSPLLYYWIVHVRSLATAATPPPCEPIIRVSSRTAARTDTLRRPCKALLDAALQPTSDFHRRPRRRGRVC